MALLLARMLLLLLSGKIVLGLRLAAPSNGERRSFQKLKSPDMVPHNMVSSYARKQIKVKGESACLESCQAEPLCIGAQVLNDGSCVLASMRIESSPGETCVHEYRSMMQGRGYGNVPMVALAESDGTIYMREDCVDEDIKIHGNTYYGLPWDWEQNGLGLARQRQGAYGVSPLLDLVSPSLLNDLISMGAPPWHSNKGSMLDFHCKSKADVAEAIEMLRSTRRGKSGGALIMEVGECICPMLANGWDPRRDLRADVVLLLHKDLNFSPASPLSFTHKLAQQQTLMRCIHKDGRTSVFRDDVEAFTALADAPQLRGMYFIQTPPISHEKVWIAPLGLGARYLPHLRPHLEPDAPERRQPRSALYEVSHNLAVDYRRDVLKAVQRNFGAEQLRSRYLPWATGHRMDVLVRETFQAVFGQSPIGVGENCFRHSELLLAGAIPVVQASLGIGSLRYLPHLAVSNWTQVTPALLENSYRKIWAQVRSGYFSFEPLTISFWLRHINATATGRGVSEFYAKFPNPPVTCESWKCI